MSTPVFVDVPFPPAPTGINTFPLDPSATVCWSGSIPDQVWRPGEVIEGRLMDQVLTVTGIYIPLLRATATQDTPFKYTLSITTGVSTTESTETQFGASLGVKGDLLSLGASLSQTLGHSTTLSTSTTETQEFDITPQSVPQISAVWWQLLLTYTITGKGHIGSFDINFSVTMQDQTPMFVSTQFPAAATLLNRAPSAGRFAPAASFAQPVL